MGEQTCSHQIHTELYKAWLKLSLELQATYVETVLMTDYTVQLQWLLRE
jgi:hypothetical protein